MTTIACAGVEVPGYFDSIPQPQLGLPETQYRQRVVGMASNGWMLYDGEWKLAKYATGGTHLLNDPDEQHNLATRKTWSATWQWRRRHPPSPTPHRRLHRARPHKKSSR